MASTASVSDMALGQTGKHSQDVRCQDRRLRDLCSRHHTYDGDLGDDLDIGFVAGVAAGSLGRPALRGPRVFLSHRSASNTEDWPAVVPRSDEHS